MSYEIKNINFEKISSDCLNKRWKDKFRFVMDLASTDHKFYYNLSGDKDVFELFSQLIILIHSLPGYFMCINTPIIGEDSFLSIKKGNYSVNISNMNSIVNYINAVRNNADKHGITSENIIDVSKNLRIPDPSIGFIDFLEEIEFEKTK